MVAFLGEKYSGKTIACALIKEALTRYYEKYTKGKWIGISTHGSKKMREITSDLTNGKFPAKTLLSEATPMTLEIISPSEGKKIEIVLRDMAGEKRKNIFEEDYEDTDQRLEEIFDMAPIDGKDYGLLAHVIFAKIYIIVIDCSKFADEHDIRMEETDIKDSIRRLWEIKERVGDATNQRIHDSIIFLFTKYDQLPATKKKLPEELMEELPEVTGALTRYHVGEISYFKSYVESEKLLKNEIDDAIKAKHGTENEDLKNAENKVKDLEVKKEDVRQEVEEDENEVVKLQKKLDEDDPEVTEQDIVDAKDEKSASLEEYNDITTQLDAARKRLTGIKEKLATSPPSTAEELGISKYKPKKPLKYSLDDYLQLIDEIIKIHKKVIGFT